MNNRRMVKNLLGELPLTAEIYWQLFQHGRPVARSFSLRRTQKNLPDWCVQAQRAAAEIHSSSQLKRKVRLFCTLRYWIEHGALLGTALSGLGHQVTLSYLPYPSFDRPISWFDVRQNNLYARDVLKAASTVMQPLSLLDIKKPTVENIPSALRQAVSDVSLRDVQYTLQIEEVEVDNPSSRSGQLYRLRQERNLLAAAAAFSWIRSLPVEQRPEVLLTPNGSILEMGAVFETARFLEIPAVTYEFGEQRGRIWLARNSQVMLQETNDLWMRAVTNRSQQVSGSRSRLSMPPARTADSTKTSPASGKACRARAASRSARN